MNLNIIMAVKGERQPRGFAFGRTAPCIKMRNEPTIIQAGPNFSNRASPCRAIREGLRDLAPSPLMATAHWQTGVHRQKQDAATKLGQRAV